MPNRERLILGRMEGRERRESFVIAAGQIFPLLASLRRCPGKKKTVTKNYDYLVMKMKMMVKSKQSNAQNGIAIEILWNLL